MTGEASEHDRMAEVAPERFNTAAPRSEREEVRAALRRAIEDFRANRADVFARLQGKAIDLQFRLIESFDDGVLASLTPSQKTALAMSLNAVVGTIYDKERLETGKSTENVSLLTRMLDSAQDQVFKNQRVAEK